MVTITEKKLTCAVLKENTQFYLNYKYVQRDFKNYESVDLFYILLRVANFLALKAFPPAHHSGKCCPTERWLLGKYMFPRSSKVL